MADRQAKRRGFTRIELLLMITALCVLLAMGVPARMGNLRTVWRNACADNLRVIAKTALNYAMENDDWIIGSPAGSGAYLLGEPQAFGPAVQTWDFMGPMLHRWNPRDPLPEPGDLNGVIKRFKKIRSTEPFLDPANGFEATHFAGPDAGTGPMISYNTNRSQLWLESGGISGITSLPSPSDLSLPPGWRPSVSRMGNPANKVFCADGAVFSAPTVPPDYDLSVNAGFGGAFAAGAAFSTVTRAWNRRWAPGNGPQIGIDARIYAYRHSIGQPTPGAGPGAFRMNLVFHDGHVETQGDLKSTDPQQWLPSGSVLRTSNVWRDTRIAFQLPGTVIIGD